MYNAAKNGADRYTKYFSCRGYCDLITAASTVTSLPAEALRTLRPRLIDKYIFIYLYHD